MRAFGRAFRHIGLAFAAALQFLTRLPVPVRTTGSEEEFRRSTVWFPAAGLIIGIITSLSGWVLGYLFPDYIVAVLVLAIWTFLSGALHLDGLMDTADAMLSHRSRERMLEIMKDSRVGAMGVIVCVLYLLLKMLLLLHLLRAGGVGGLVMLAVIPMWGRAFMVTAIAGWPYARSGQGLGQLFRTAGAGEAAGAAGLAAVLTGLAIGLAGAGLGWDRFGPLFALGDFGHSADGLSGSLFVLPAVAAMAVVTYLAGWAVSARVARKLGGLTGDIYGALNEIIEVALLLVLCGWMYVAA